MTQYPTGPGELERWARADAVFSEALDVAPGQRAQFVREACGADLELAASVMELLDATDADAAFLDSPADILRDPLTELFAEGAADPELGRRLGAYRVLERIARGGAGTVYLGERADGAFEQRVAIKVLRPGLDSEDVLRRFRAERQILASLDHPHIARLLDGGATDGARPYMVMEHVAGVPITEFCDTHRLRVRERLRLFVLVTRAVEHAHRALVVHRDIKPSNILVTADGTPRLLDFGIARLLDPDGDAERTQTAMWAMTPAYASPEQLRGERVTTATDVYQLGVLLYVLLTGCSPFPSDAPAARLATLTTDPARPSTVLGRNGGRTTNSGGDDVARRRNSEPAALQRELRGDLDTIVLKCLRVEPAARYASAEALARDVESYLARRPIAARPATFTYRAGRLVARRPGAMGAVAAGAVAMAVYVGSLQAYAVRLQTERDRASRATVVADDARGRALLALERAETGEATARAERERAEAALLATLQATAAADAARRDAEAARAAADMERDRAVAEEQRTGHALDFTLSLFRQPARDGVRMDTLSANALLGYAATRVLDALHDDVESRSRLLVTIGEAYGSLGAGDDATRLLQEAVDLNRRMYGPAAPRSIDLLEQLASARRAAFQLDAARDAYTEALRLRRAQAVPDTTALSRNLRGLALTMRDLARPDTAVLLLQEAIALVDRDGRNEQDIIGDLADTGMVLRGVGDLDGAERAYAEALRRMRGREKEFGAQLTSLLNNYAFLLRSAGRRAEAEPLYREALDGVVAAQGPHSLISSQVRHNLARLLQEMDRLDAAEALVQENLAGYLALWGRDSWQGARGIGQLADHYLRAGRLAEAEDGAREALRINAAVLGATHSYTAFSHHRIGTILQAQRRFAEAELELLAALRIAEDPQDRSGRGAAPLMRAALVELYTAWDHPERAAAYR